MGEGGLRGERWGYFVELHNCELVEKKLYQLIVMYCLVIFCIVLSMGGFLWSQSILLEMRYVVCHQYGVVGV